MVPVGMGEDKMIQKTPLCDQAVAEAANAGTGIHDDDVVTFGSDFQTSGITTVFYEISPRNWNGAS
jgi:hypothetical protein